MQADPAIRKITETLKGSKEKGSARASRLEVSRPITRADLVSSQARSHIRLEHRYLALHECVSVARECQAVFGLQQINLTPVHALPRALLADLLGDES